MTAPCKHTPEVGNTVVNAQARGHKVQRLPIIQLQQFGYRKYEYAQTPEHSDNVVASPVFKAAVCPVEEEHPENR